MIELSVSNPDTIAKNCYIRVKNNGNLIKAVPFLYSRAAYAGGYFFNYFKFSFLSCEVTQDNCISLQKNENPIFINPPNKLYNLCEEIDAYENQHRFHPEEILAYYWSYEMVPESRRDFRQSLFVSKIRKILDNDCEMMIE